MSGRRLIFADDTIIENGEAGFANGIVVCFIDMSLVEAFQIFSVPEKTSVIRFQYGGMESEYEGFTEIAYMLTGDRLAVGMRRPV